MLNKAYELRRKFKTNGIILTGDFNARHTAWGDQLNNAYGRALLDQLDASKFSIYTSSTPTFLSSNGSSCIDLTIVSHDLIDKIVSCDTDNYTELYSGAPFRGHLPLITKIKLTTNDTYRPQVEKTKLEKISWVSWTKELEDILSQNEDYLNNLEDPKEFLSFFDEAIEASTNKHSTKKTSSAHSKPYWTRNLTILCNEMRTARKNYFKRNTPTNKRQFHPSKRSL